MNLTNMRLAVALLFFTGVASASNVQEHRVRLEVGQKLARADALKPGVHRYLRYTIKEGKRTAIDIWERRLTLDNSIMAIDQRWDGVGDRVYTRLQHSEFEPETFRPLRHTSEGTREGQTKREGFVFEKGYVRGDATMPNNDKASFEQSMAEPAYNFETDIELFQSLPLELGAAFEIPFYDPGLAPAARYTFKVVGEDTVDGPGGRVDCWVLSGDYNRPNMPPARFWIAKHSQVLVREEQPYEGTLWIKTLLSPESGDPD